MAKSSGCFSRGPRFNFQFPQGDFLPSITPALGNLAPSSHPLKHCTQTHKEAEHPNTFNKKIKLKAFFKKTFYSSAVAFEFNPMRGRQRQSDLSEYGVVVSSRSVMLHSETFKRIIKLCVG